MSEKPYKLLDNLHHLVCEELVDRIVSGKASTADLVAAIRMLKDNGISVAAENSQPLRDLAKTVPFKVVEDLREAN